MQAMSYLGDGVYIGLNEHNQLTLWTSNGLSIQNKIVLDDVVPQLTNFLIGYSGKDSPAEEAERAS